MKFTLSILAASLFSSAFATYGPNEGPVANKRQPYTPKEGELARNEAISTKCLGLGMKPSLARYPTSVAAMKLISERGAKVIIETGTTRDEIAKMEGAGGFTVIFGCYAQGLGARLTSVDIDAKNCATARRVTSNYRNNVSVVCSDSLPFLEKYSVGLIDFLYLDSFDYDSKNPAPSQNHHLKEIQAAYNKLHSQSVVMVDDCDLPGGGKCKLVEAFLLERGWKMVMNGYQQIFVYE